MEKTYVYNLTTENGGWLAQIVLTSDGMFASVTDYGNFSFAWRSFGKDFRNFILSLNNQYFGSKMAEGNAYILYSKKLDKQCQMYAEKILPALQKAIKEEIESENISN